MCRRSTQYACVRIYVIVFQTLFVCLFEFGTGPESRVNRGSGFLGGGEVYSAGRCKEGSGLEKHLVVWSAV